MKSTKYSSELKDMGFEKPIEVIMLTAFRDGIISGSSEYISSLEKSSVERAIELAMKKTEAGNLSRKTFRQLAAWDIEDLAAKYEHVIKLYK